MIRVVGTSIRDKTEKWGGVRGNHQANQKEELRCDVESHRVPSCEDFTSV